MRASLQWLWNSWGTPATSTQAVAQTGGPAVELVLLAVIDGPLIAEMALSALEAAAIPALIQRKPVATIYGFAAGAWGALPILVPAPLLDQAREVLIGMGLLTEHEHDPAND